MSDPDNKHTIGHDELNQAFDNGSIFKSSPEDLERYLCALGSLNIQSDPVRTKAIVRALTINHVQMSRMIRSVEDTMTRLNAANDQTQRSVVRLTWIAIAVGVIQALAGVLAIIG